MSHENIQIDSSWKVVLADEFAKPPEGERLFLDPHVDHKEDKGRPQFQALLQDRVYLAFGHGALGPSLRGGWG